MSAEAFQLLSAENADYHENERFVGVFVKGTPTIDHVGLIYASATLAAPGVPSVKETKELHFVTNNLVLNTALTMNKKYFHAPLGLDEINARSFAAFLTAVANKNSGTPPILYGMDWQGSSGCFDANGNYLNPNEITGLTCAIFISELLSARELDAVKVSEWKGDEPQDLFWRAEKLAEYRSRIENKKTKITLEQVEHMENISPFKRLRPEQIAAATASDYGDWPLAYDHATELARQLLLEFSKVFDEEV